jgi:hypothetical protein
MPAETVHKTMSQNETELLPDEQKSLCDAHDGLL